MSEAVLKIDGPLIHFGRKGMKWGTRKAGTGAPSKRSKGSGKKAKPRLDTSKMSNEELRRVIDRMKLDQQFAEMSSPKKANGKKFAKSVIESSGKTAAAAVVSTAVGIGIGKAFKKP